MDFQINSSHLCFSGISNFKCTHFDYAMFSYNNRNQFQAHCVFTSK